MKKIPYKLPKTLAIESLRGREVQMDETETLAEFARLVESEPSVDENVRRLAQGQLDIIKQRWVRDWLDSEEGRKYHAENGDDATLAKAQEIADTEKYGGRERKTSAQTAKAKQAVTFADQVVEAAKTNPKALDRLRAMGFDVDGLLAANAAAEAEKAEKAAKAASNKAAEASAPATA